MGRKLAGAALLVGGATMALGILANLGGGHPLAAVMGALALFAAAPIGGGIWLLGAERRRARALEAAADQQAEAGLLRLASARDGHLTVAEVVAHAGLEAARAEQLLDALCRRGFAEHRIADDGTLVYRVRPLLGAAEKRRAVGVDDV